MPKCDNREKPRVMRLSDCLTSKDTIKSFLEKKPEFADKNGSDYALLVNETHIIYKYETESEVVYVHYGSDDEGIFKICYYTDIVGKGNH